MGWKIYALGSLGNSTEIATAAVSKLQELGCGASYSSYDNYRGTLVVSVAGVGYSGEFGVGDTGYAPAFLCIDDETNSIVICKNYGTFNIYSQFKVVACFVLLHGTNADTGNPGLFTLANVRNQPIAFTNMWEPVSSGDTILLHRALFRNDGTSCLNSFAADDLYWGSISLTPGAVITVGADSFVCLNYNLFAKL